MLLYVLFKYGIKDLRIQGVEVDRSTLVNSVYKMSPGNNG